MNKEGPPIFSVDKHPVYQEHERKNRISRAIFQMAGFKIGEKIIFEGREVEILKFRHTSTFSRNIPAMLIQSPEEDERVYFSEVLLDEAVNENSVKQKNNVGIDKKEMENTSRESFEMAGFKIGDNIVYKTDKNKTINCKVNSFGIEIRNGRNVPVAYISSYLATVENKIKNKAVTLVELCRDNILEKSTKK